VSLATPESVWKLQAALHVQAKGEEQPPVGENMNHLVRKPDAGKLHVRFDERGVETEKHGELLRHRQPKGPVSATASPKLHRATPRLYKRGCSRGGGGLSAQIGVKQR
jgi:hypothetical protein